MPLDDREVKQHREELADGTLRPHSQVDLITRICPVRFEPEARSELWETFLARVLPDEEVRAAIQRAVGYSLVGENLDEVLFFGWAPTRSGKSTFSEAIKAALGEYAGTADFSSFLAPETPAAATRRGGISCVSPAAGSSSASR